MSMFVTLPTDNIPESCDKAERALVRCTDIIVESTIDPFILARKLYSKEIISEDVYKRVQDKPVEIQTRTVLKLFLKI